jgi:hypothetical protein
MLTAKYLYAWQKTRALAQSRFLSLGADREVGFRGSPADSAAGDSAAGPALVWLWNVHKAWDALEARKARLVRPLTEDEEAIRGRTLRLVGPMVEAGSTTGQCPSFAALLLHVGLLLLEPGQDKGLLLDDHCKCYEHLVAGLEAPEGVDSMAVSADACVSLLGSGEQGAVIRGLREVVKRAWVAVCKARTLSWPTIEVFLSVTCPGSVSAQDGEQSGGEHSEEEERRTRRTRRRRRRRRRAHATRWMRTMATVRGER